MKWGKDARSKIVWAPVGTARRFGLEILRRDQTQFRASRAMSAFGKSRRYKAVAATPALDPITEVECASQQSRIVLAQLLDHLVGEHELIMRNR
jgi:hypothetical protein